MKTVIPKDFLDRIDFGKVAKYAAYLLLCLILQNIIFTQLRLFDVCPLVLPAVAVAMGMFEGAVWGPLFSLLLGIFADMAFVENTIFFTLVFPAVSFAAAFVANFFINRRFYLYGRCGDRPADYGRRPDPEDIRFRQFFYGDGHDGSASDTVVAAFRRTGVSSASPAEQSRLGRRIE